MVQTTRVVLLHLSNVLVSLYEYFGLSMSRLGAAGYYPIAFEACGWHTRCWVTTACKHSCEMHNTARWVSTDSVCFLTAATSSVRICWINGERSMVRFLGDRHFRFETIGGQGEESFSTSPCPRMSQKNWSTRLICEKSDCPLLKKEFRPALRATRGKNIPHTSKTSFIRLTSGSEQMCLKRTHSCTCAYAV